MDLDHVTFAGPDFDERSPILDMLPDNLAGLLRQINGFIMYEGGLHVRGVCLEPSWHSLENTLIGPSALHKLYPAVEVADVPFAQDCLADQYLLRARSVCRLEAETGVVTPLNLSLPEFFRSIQEDPVEFLGMHPLLRHQREIGSLQPGQVLHAYPPFCTKQAADGVSLRAVPAGEAILFLADFARQISGLGEGENFQVTVTPRDA
jgi:hypothetical protein